MLDALRGELVFVLFWGALLYNVLGQQRSSAIFLVVSAVPLYPDAHDKKIVLVFFGRQ